MTVLNSNPLSFNYVIHCNAVPVGFLSSKMIIILFVQSFPPKSHSRLSSQSSMTEEERVGSMDRSSKRESEVCVCVFVCVCVCLCEIYNI